MKVFVLLITISAGFSCVSSNSAECKGKVITFDCAEKGYPYYDEGPDGECFVWCRFGYELLSCENVHPHPDTPAYKNEVCYGKGNLPFDCNGTLAKGEPCWIEEDCHFDCLVGGDMLLSCAQIWAVN